MLGRRRNGGWVKYKIIDIDGTEISLTDLLDRYFFSVNHHTSCSVVLQKFHNNTIEHHSILEDTQIQNNEVQEKKSEKLDNVENKINNSIDDTTTKQYDYSTYRYAPEQIEEFFASDNGQKEKHTLEDSICRPLIGKRNNMPYFLYCKICPKVEFLPLESMENHIRLAEPDRHKAKLLDTIQGDQTNKYENKNKDQDRTLNQ